MSIAEAYDMPVARAPLVPPSPPRAPDDMTVFGRMKAIRISPIGSWGQRAYEEDIVQGRFLGRNSFILNAPDAIKHVLVDNYENYIRTPVSLRVLRPILGEGLLDFRRARVEASAPDAGAGFHAARSDAAHSSHAGGDRRDGRQAQSSSNAPVDLREAMQRMALEIAGRTMFSFGMDRHGAALRDFVMEYGERLARPHFLDLLLPLGWPSPQDFVPRPFPQALDGVRRHADGRTPRRRQERGRAGARSVRPDGRRARSGNRRRLYRRAARRSGRDHDFGRP